MINHGLNRDIAISMQREFVRKTAEANLRRAAAVSNDADEASKTVAPLPRGSFAAPLRWLSRGLVAHEKLRFPA